MTELLGRPGTTHESDDGHGAAGFILWCRLDEDALSREESVEFGNFKEFVDLDRLGGTLEFTGVCFALLLEPVECA